MLLAIPTEIRLEIYKYLLDDGGAQWLSFENKTTHLTSPSSPASSPHAVPTCCAAGSTKQPTTTTRRTRYHVMQRAPMCQQRCYQTTYCLAPIQHAQASFHTSIMAACRRFHHEAAELLYGSHGFAFGAHALEAAVPFLTDRTAYTRALTSRIAVYRRGPFPSWGYLSHENEWAGLCRFLAASGALRRLRVTVEGGRPAERWEGPQVLSEADIRLLKVIRFDGLDWINDLVAIEGLEELEIVPDVKRMSTPGTPVMGVYAAFSASMEGGFVDLLRAEMKMVGGSNVVVGSDCFVGS